MGPGELLVSFTAARLDTGFHGGLGGTTRPRSLAECGGFRTSHCPLPQRFLWYNLSTGCTLDSMLYGPLPLWKLFSPCSSWKVGNLLLRSDWTVRFWRAFAIPPCRHVLSACPQQMWSEIPLSVQHHCGSSKMSSIRAL